MIRRLAKDGSPAGHGKQPEQDELGRFRWEIYARRNGKRIHRIVWAKTKTEALHEEEAIKTGAATSGITWSAGLTLWLQAANPSPSHQYSMEKGVERLIQKHGDLLIEETTPAQFGSVVDDRKKVSNRTAQAQRAIRRIATWLREKGIVAVLPFEHVPGFSQRPVNPRREIRAPAPYLDSLRSPRLIVEFILLTGIRSTEACTLKKDSVRGDALLMRQKGGSFREIYLDKVMLEIIRKAKNKTAFLFVNSRGTSWNHGSLLHACQRSWKKAGLPMVCIHELRHTFATLAARAGFSSQQLKEAMGWTTARMADKYVHLGKEDSRAVAIAVREEIRKKLS
jgi:hypothetical protein